VGGVSVLLKSAKEKRARPRWQCAALQGEGQMDKRKFLATGWPPLNRPCGGYIFRIDFV
jgi:hypothetical protein